MQLPDTLQAVLFDMDGLLLDTERLARDIWYAVAREQGYELTDAIYLPILGTNVAGTKRIIQNAFGEATPVDAMHLEKHRRLEDAVLCCTTPEPMRRVRGFDALRDAVRFTSYGADCLAYAFVAMGGADLIVDRDLKPYDWCALVPIVTEAGGVMLDWQGRALTLASDGAVVAASGEALARAAIALVARDEA